MSADRASLIRQIKNAIDIIDLRQSPNAPNILPQATSVDLCKMILLGGASLLEDLEVEARL